MRLGLNPTLLIFVTILVLGVTLLYLTETVLEGSGPPREGIERQGAVYLWQGSDVLPGDTHDCSDLDGSGGDDSSAKPTGWERGSNGKDPCGRDNYRHVDIFRPCGKAWSG
jgi:hypothetical protein